MVELVLVAAAAGDLDDDVDLSGHAATDPRCHREAASSRRTDPRWSHGGPRLPWPHGVPPHHRAAPVRLHDHRRAEGRGPASRHRRHRPGLRQPRHAVARHGGREAGRGGPQPPQPPLLGQPGHPQAAPGRSPTSTCAASASTLDPDPEVITTIGAKEGFSHLMWVLLRPGRRRPGAVAVVPDPHLGPLFAGAVCPRDPAVDRRRTSSSGCGRPTSTPGPSPGSSCSASRTTRRPPCVDLDFFQRGRRLRPRARRHRRPRQRLRRAGLRRLRAAVDPAGRGRQGVRGRAVLDDQVVLDGRVAGGVPGRQRRGRAGAGQAQVVPRLRHLPAHPDRRHRHA